MRNLGKKGDLGRKRPGRCKKNWFMVEKYLDSGLQWHLIFV